MTQDIGPWMMHAVTKGTVDHVQVLPRKCRQIYLLPLLKKILNAASVLKEGKRRIRQIIHRTNTRTKSLKVAADSDM
jgi:hypothetical protein